MRTRRDWAVWSTTLNALTRDAFNCRVTHGASTAMTGLTAQDQLYPQHPQL